MGIRDVPALLNIFFLSCYLNAQLLVLYLVVITSRERNFPQELMRTVERMWVHCALRQKALHRRRHLPPPPLRSLRQEK